LSLAVSGCSWISWLGESEEQVRLETESTAPTRVPDELDQPQFVDLMPIPNVVDYRGLAGTPLEVGLPQALSTTFGVDTIVIRTLGDQRWVFVDLPPATIWPQVVLFWEENHLPVAMLDPRNGTLETEWLVGRTGDTDEIYDSLLKGQSWRVGEALQQYKFRVRVEAGVRNGSTELFVEQVQRDLGGDREPAWRGESDNAALEGKILSSIAYFLGDRTAEGPAVSLLAAGLRESKATLVTEADGMVLKYRLDFDRAWATVGAALENARVAVEDLDRTSAVYYVKYTSGHDPDPGLLKRIFSRNDKQSELEEGYQFEVHVDPQGEEVLVTIAGDMDVSLTSTENLILRERLLKLIKEYST
jgi:outer membrane protein assembly factor BamC